MNIRYDSIGSVVSLTIELLKRRSSVELKYGATTAGLYSVGVTSSSVSRKRRRVRDVCAVIMQWCTRQLDSLSSVLMS
jgi:hypothetical protein